MILIKREKGEKEAGEKKGGQSEVVLLRKKKMSARKKASIHWIIKPNVSIKKRRILLVHEKVNQANYE